MLVVVETACRDEKEAMNIGSTVVHERLAACANVIPSVDSFFCWDHQFSGEHEALVLLKTTSAKLAKLEKRIGQLHSYKTPAIISWKARANKEYEKWAKKELKARGRC